MVVRFALASAGERDMLVRAVLPLGMRATGPRESSHRDVYLDTASDALRRHGITCRLRVDGSGRNLLSVRFGGGDAPPTRLDSEVRAGEAPAALAENTEAGRCLRSLVEPRLLAPRLELDVHRLTRDAHPDLLRRPRLQLHYDRIAVLRDGALHTLHQLCTHQRRGSSDALERLANALEREHDLRRVGEDRRDHHELAWRDGVPPGVSRVVAPSASRATTAPARVDRDADDDMPAEMLNPELSLLAFQRRVLALAQDVATPLRARLRFLGIVTSNLDELFMTRMAELRRAAHHDDDARIVDAPDGLSARRRLDLVEREVTSIVEDQARCALECLAAADRHGARMLRWTDLEPREKELLRARCRDEIYPGLTPLAMTMSPGHPVPHLPHLGLSLAVVFRRTSVTAPHLAELELPSDSGRLLAVPGRAADVIAIEEVVRATLAQLYPNGQVDGAYLFRVTRGGELGVDETGADDLLSAVSRATERRPHNAVVRVEVERAMPDVVRDLVLDSLRREAGGRLADTVVSSVQPVDGLLDLRCLAELPLSPDPALEYPALTPRVPVRQDQPMLDAIRDGDILLHHPFDSFEASVVRFVREAADDPLVTTIKITLYRVGDPSAVVDALLDAARSGKRVAAIVELKARFDEEQNVTWARALEAAGAHVVYGLVGLKVHAKVALVVRREGARLQRYAHVGTGNYNERSGRQYTDLSLFSAGDALTADVADLFNALTGSSRSPAALSHGALVAPEQLLPSLLALIARETQHASEGRVARIAVKVNGLSDPEVVRALKRAADAGVTLDLVVRGICTIRPGVAGRSARVRVVSVVGRFLEHSRVYRFENGGAPEFFIGSSDLRPRNLRRRVELLVPMPLAAHRMQLDQLLAAYLDDPTAWMLQGDGRYERRTGNGPGAQDAMMAAVERVHAGDQASMTPVAMTVP